MYNFGRPPRALESFGVVGLLGDDCKVYYDSVFSARHIGRVSDLLTAQLKRVAPTHDELGFRRALLFSLYEAYRCQLQALGRGGETLPEPLVIECGVDREKIAIGVSFSYSKDQAVNPPEGRIESFISQMAADTDQVVVRIEERTRRIEVVSLLALPGEADLAARGEKSPVEVVTLRPDVKVSKLKAQYVELGDLDYGKLLSEDGPAGPKEKPATGELLAEGGDAESRSSENVAGAAASKERVTRISGVTQHFGDEEDTEIETVRDEASDGAARSDAEKALGTAKRQIEMYQEQIAQLQVKIGGLEQRLQTEIVPVGIESEEKRASSLKEIIRSFWPFNKGEGGDKDAQPRGEPAQASQMVEPPSAGTPALPDTDSGDPAAGFKEEIEGLQKTIEMIQHESERLKKELGNGRAKRWAEGMVGELLSEKARLNEVSKKLNVTLRQKELEFKNKTITLQEELRRKDEQLRQKTYALERAKEQVSQASVSIEKNRAGNSVASEETQFRQKLQFTQKLLAGAKEENLSLSRRLEEVRGQLAVAQSASKAKLQRDLDYDTMRSKYNNLMRQAEDFKRANHQLMERVNDFEKQKPAGNPEDLKRKLEAAMRVVATHQKDAELLRAKVEEMQKAEARLKSELARAMTALRAARTSGGGGEGGSQAA